MILSRCVLRKERREHFSQRSGSLLNFLTKQMKKEMLLSFYRFFRELGETFRNLIASIVS